MPLRVYETSELLISEDNLDTPEQINFSNTSSFTDITNISEVKTISETFPIGTTAVSLGNIAAGKFIHIKPTNNCQIDIDGEVLSLRGGKETKMWVNFTAVSLIVATATNKIILVLAGD